MELHLVATRHFLLGTCNLVLLPLPPGWRLVDGPVPPEVDRWLRRDGVAWATAGRGSYRVLVPGEGGAGRPGQALSLEVRVGPVPGLEVRVGGRPPLARVHAAGSGLLAGHPGTWALGEVGRGFPRRFRPALWVDLECPETERRLSLFAEGAEPAVLERFLAALRAGPLCHGPDGGERPEAGAEAGRG
ncbi:MAG: hypothetical protein L6E13_08570 [Firmicutes bacterium]|nr:hypothetical protein [Bacillota bacterium]